MKETIINWFTFGKPPENMDWLDQYICEINLNNIKVTSGIYFLFKGEAIQYIGQSINILSRIGSHMKDKDFDKVYFLPIEASVEMLEHVESEFINLYHPPLNKTLRSSCMFSAKQIVEALNKTNIKMTKTEEEIADIDERQQRALDAVAEIFNSNFNSALYDKAAQLFGDCRWVGSRKLSEIKERFFKLLEKGKSKPSQHEYHDLMLSIAVMEQRLKVLSEIKSLDELEGERIRLNAQIKWLTERRNHIEQMQAKNLPDLIA